MKCQDIMKTNVECVSLDDTVQDAASCMREKNVGFLPVCEADRVLQSPGWLLIHDFYSPAPSKREYHHRAGLFSHKMDYRTLFTWHPAYVTYSHRVRDHAHGGYTDAPQEWVGTSVLRKQSDRQ